jgi:predicted ATPase/DNA-binding winged helix-turn-helix (wHTH) protein
MERASSREFPPFRLDTGNECLWRHRDDKADERICLTPKAFAVLRFLVEHAGHLVTEEELLEAAWPKVYVQPEAVKTRIYEIRKLLGDDPKSPRFIETLARRGYRFIAPIADASAPAAIFLEMRPSRLVGRDPQLAELRSGLQRTLATGRQVVFITGETGIGKTTLADECVRRAAAEVAGLRVTRGQCVEGHGGKEPYYPVLEAIGQLCRGPGGATLVQILSAQAPSWLVQFPDLVPREQRERLQQEILGATRDRMLREIGDALETFSEEKPLLMVLEDLHWADPSTVDFISTLARRRGSGKLMLIGTYRPVDITLAQHPLKAVKQDLLVHQLCREIALQPLTEAQVADYLAIDMAGAVPDGLAALIYRYSEGNPLFMVAAVDHMRNRYAITAANGTWQFNEPLENIALEAPESLRQMIEFQIEKLSAEEQRMLEIASVHGVSFTADVGSAVDPEKFESVCEDLSRRQFMLRRTGASQFPDGTISECYQFVHALYRDVFYRRQMPARRAKLQQRIGARATEALPLPA